MRALIADDEALARAKLRRFLTATDDMEIVGEASTGREAVALIKRLGPDVVFLDIRMPGLDGFGVIDAIAPDEAPYIVFVTANEEHALRAFDVGAVDYLLKPYTPERFARVLDRARARVATHTGVPETVSHSGAPFLQRLLVIANGRAVFLATSVIDRVEAERNYLSIVSGAVTYRLRATVNALQSRLDPAQFLRVNRSTLVRLDAVADMHEWSHGNYRVVLRDGTEVMWSRRYRAAAERDFGVQD